MSDLWHEFDAMLQQASHVLVLGHSLHDPALLDKLVEHSPSCSTAITFFEKDTAGKEFVGRSYSRFYGPASTIPAVFGPSEVVADLAKVTQWLKETS